MHIVREDDLELVTSVGVCNEALLPGTLVKWQATVTRVLLLLLGVLVNSIHVLILGISHEVFLPGVQIKGNVTVDCTTACLGPLVREALLLSPRPRGGVCGESLVHCWGLLLLLLLLLLLGYLTRSGCTGG